MNIKRVSSRRCKVCGLPIRTNLILNRNKDFRRIKSICGCGALTVNHQGLWTFVTPDQYNRSYLEARHNARESKAQNIHVKGGVTPETTIKNARLRNEREKRKSSTNQR